MIEIPGPDPAAPPPPPAPAPRSPAGAPDAAHAQALRPELVGDFLSALDRAVRGRRLYQANNPVYLGFVAALRGALERIWAESAGVAVGIEEQAFRWEDGRFAIGEGRDSLPQVFYKDGVRQLTFLPGFEDEIDRFLSVLQRVRQLDQDLGDDLVTLLWAEEFSALQYSYVDALAEGIDVPEPPLLDAAARVDPAQVRRDAQTTDSPSPAVERGEPPVATITRDDFDPTLYFLDPDELERLRREVDREWRRPVRDDVLSALFDRLEEPLPARQLEILRILRQLLSAFLTQGDLPSASRVLLELNTLLGEARLAGPQREEAESLFRDLSEPELLGAFFRSLVAVPGAADAPELGVFLQHLGRGALPPLLRTTESIEDVALRERLTTAIERLAAQHPAELLDALGAEAPLIAAGAARLAGRLALTAATPAIVKLLGRPDAAVRRVAVDALARIRNSAAMEGMQQALRDEDREVRLQAVRAIADARYPPARKWLDQAMAGDGLHNADITERIAFFEALGAVADAATVARLDRTLNGRRLLGRDPPEIRACAALALGRAGTPEATAALRRALEESTNPIVRNAVNRALRRDSAQP